MRLLILLLAITLASCAAPRSPYPPRTHAPCFEYETCVVAVQQAISRNWMRPSTARNGMQVTVFVELGMDYELLAQRVTEPSGNKAFDQSAMDAIAAAAPFDELRGMERVMGFFLFSRTHFKFRPEDLGRQS